MVRFQSDISHGLVIWYVIATSSFIAQKAAPSLAVNYSFGMQRMDLFHQLGLSLRCQSFRLEVQQAVGQRSAASGILFAQTGLECSYAFARKAVEFAPYLRLNYGRLARPFAFNHYRMELGQQLSLPLNRMHIFPVDPFLSMGISQAWEKQNIALHSFLDFSLYLGVRYAFD
ncbi:MAG: hypothetical protein RL432_1717 [Bacteroidota bacterium]|jgi:hypothetical protein